VDQALLSFEIAFILLTHYIDMQMGGGFGAGSNGRCTLLVTNLDPDVSIYYLTANLNYYFFPLN
jgi:hypothetical protein